MPGIIYKINYQNVQMFEDNYKCMDGVHFSLYFDFETTYAKKSFEFDDEAELHLVFVVAFNPVLKLQSWTKYLETFSCFITISLYHNLKETRLLSPESECTSCLTSCQTT